MRIDLHTHSSASDGTDSPTELVQVAAAAGLDVVALTDHDTAAGWDAARAALPPGLTLVRGVEMSCTHTEPDGRRVGLHLLAYLADPTSPALTDEWRRLGDTRAERGRRMVDNLTRAGYPISWAQVAALADGAPIGRPHIGRALVAAAVVPDVDTAFRELLSSRQPYYVRKVDTELFTAIALVRDAGGLPVFAHPIARRRGPVLSDETVVAMVDAGLVGLEVDHPDHDADDRAHAAGLAARLGLIATGSSDYHGSNKRTPIAACTTDPEQYARLLELPSALRPLSA